MQHHWLTALTNTYVRWDRESGDPEPAAAINKIQISCNGHNARFLYDYSPFDHTEKSALHQRKTKRMSRRWRRAVNLFWRRTFTTVDTDVALVNAGGLLA